MDGTRNVGRLSRGNSRTGCVGICNDGFGKIFPICARRLIAEFLQELFTREDPFHPFFGVTVMKKILEAPPDRPSAENTRFRLTDEWWGICSKCWHSDPPMRPTMSQVAKEIEKIVCSCLVTRLSITDRCHTSASGSAIDPSCLANFTHYHSHVYDQNRFSCETWLEVWFELQRHYMGLNTLQVRLHTWKWCSIQRSSLACKARHAG